MPVSYSAAEALPPALATTQEHEEQKLQRSCRELRARLATGDAGIAAFGRAVRGPKVPWLRFSTSMGYYMLYIYAPATDTTNHDKLRGCWLFNKQLTRF